MKAFFKSAKRAAKGDSKTLVSREGMGRVVLAVGTCAVLCFLLSVHLLPNKVSLRVGEVSPDTIIARRTVSYEDREETDQRRAQAAAKVGPAYDPIPGAPERAAGTLKTVLQTVDNVRSLFPDMSSDRQVAQIRAKLGSELGQQVSNSSFRLLLTAEPAQSRAIKEAAGKLVSAAAAKDIEDEASLKLARNEVLTRAVAGASDRGAGLAVGELAADALRPNRVLSTSRTLELQERARSSVQPVYRQIVPGQTIISKGELVLTDHILKFEALGLRNPSIDLAAFASLTMFVILAVFLVSFYLKYFQEDIYASIKDLILLCVVVVLSTLALRISGSLLGLELSPEQVGYMGLTCVVTAGMMLGVLFNPSLAVVVTALLSIVLSLTLHSDLQFAANALIISLVGIHSVARLRNISDLTRAIGLLSGTGMALVWITGGISGQPLNELLAGTFWAGVATPLGSAILFLLGTWLLERPFGRTTHIYLLELSDTNRPLLKRLVMEAPGTYTHSVLCAYLADAAAEAIGADSLLARVGAYYHDVGKIRRPHFFIENQHVENVHDRLSPTLSVLVILSHIKDGLEVGREYKLPKVILDIIAQHQGTSLVQYFYHQLGTQHDRPEEMEQRFRYPGPKPQTREAAIVMLADVVEAASHSQDKPTAATIETMVDRVVAEKLRDGQLEECDLSFKEVRIISRVFVKALMGTLHARIEYPDVFSAIGKKSVINAGPSSEPTEFPDSDQPAKEDGAAVPAG